MVGEADRLVEVVGDEDDGLVQHALKTEELILHLAADQRVEGREGFVEEPQVRLDRERAGDADALLLAARKLSGIIGLAAFQPHQFDHLTGAFFALGPRDALHFEREGGVLKDGQVRQKGEVLEDHAHLAAADLDHFLVGHRQEVAPLEEDFAAGRFDQAG